MADRPDRAAELASLQLDIQPQPDDVTCGPTCLHAVYRYYGNAVPLEELVAAVPKTPSGGTADVYLANDALRRGYRATIHTYNIRLFDPTWFEEGVDIADKLRQQAEFKGAERPMLAQLTEAYLRFLDLGGRLRFTDLTASFVRRHLRRGVPILTGLSSTYLYRHPREYGENDDDDDIRGEPQGHFVLLCGYHSGTRTVLVADPFEENPLAPGQHYEVSLDRAIGAIMLGVLTHDASMLVIEPKDRASKAPD
ncbi:MAG: C39 family peptidase [Planctomycetes bacterium]|nr:C39 family peptidase [Planctomycetota bacterium]MCB9885443.1 C39 family peptidase [Planctomycetota bacterium]